MKLRPIITAIAILAGILHVHAGNGGHVRLTYGTEWSYIGNINTTWHHNFFDPVDEYRNNDKGTSFGYSHHGEILAHVGLDLGKNFNLSLYTGYSGISPNLRVVPVSLRGTWSYGKDRTVPGWFSFLEGGSGVCVTRPDTPYYAGKIGTGYRIPLSASTRLDFILAFRLSYASPEIYDDGTAVPEKDINRNDNFYSAISVGIGLTF